MKRIILFSLLSIFTALYFKGAYAGGPIQIGKKLVNFKLKTLEGKRTEIHDAIKGRAAVINFTTTWCHDCKKLARIFEKIIPRYRKKGIEFIFVYVGQKKKLVGKGVSGKNRKSAPFRLLDEKRKAAAKLKLTGIPHVITVDRKGVIKYKGLPLEEKMITREIDKLVSNNMP